ncbi:hypothetical protein J6590_003971 [Homalodisca vitripennis]|nr:hypothetical protein J6590_003971 [Homalodisca vitripennis]
MFLLLTRARVIEIEDAGQVLVLTLRIGSEPRSDTSATSCLCPYPRHVPSSAPMDRSGVIPRSIVHPGTNLQVHGTSGGTGRAT